MNEEPNQFPLPNPVDLISADIGSELTKAGIKVQRIGTDITDKNFTVTTDKKVPEEIKSRIRKYAENYGFPIKFLTA